jgi:arsenite methyltransferase
VGQLAFDDETARRIEALYLIGDAERRRRLVRAALGAAPGEVVLDIGCGPGFYCAELLEEVGPSGRVVGVDSSAAMLALAARRCAGHDNVAFHEGDAADLQVPDGTFDAALCVQVLEYVAEPERGLAEMHRVLRPGGRVLVWDIDWATLSMRSEDASLTRRILEAWDEHLAHRSLPRTLAPLLRSVGFEDVRMEAHPFAATTSDPDGYGAALVPFIGTFVAGRRGITEQEASAWVAAQRALGERGEFFFTVTQFCFTALKPGRRGYSPQAVAPGVA